MLSKKLAPPKFESLVGPTASPIVSLVESATGAAVFTLVTFAPISSSAVLPANMQLATTSLGFISGSWSRRSSVPLQLIVSDRTRSDTATEILQRLNVVEKANPSMASQIADARIFALALPSGLTIPRAWTDGETEVVLEWINGEKHAIVSFEGDGQFGYAMRRGDRFAPGSSPNDLTTAKLDDLIDYLGRP